MRIKSYSIKEIFLSIQGEGFHSGRPAVFLRFSGCNLWDGSEEGRERGIGSCSKWCDTDFQKGEPKTSVQIADEIRFLWGSRDPQPFVVCTGGEPLLQMDAALIRLLKSQGFILALETNGTLPLPWGFDWVCVSPKQGSPLTVRKGNELKFIYPQIGTDPKEFEDLEFDHLYLQPKYDQFGPDNADAAMWFCIKNPKWKLSLQIQKYLGVR